MWRALENASDKIFRLRSGISRGARMQELKEEERVALYTHYRSKLLKRNDLDFEQIREEEPFELGNESPREHCDRQILEQLTCMYKHVHRQNGGTCVETTSSIHKVPTSASEPSWMAKWFESPFSEEDENNTEASNPVDTEMDAEVAMDFSVQVSESSLPNAGDGVHVIGKATRGSVVAIYPGLVGTQEHLEEIMMELDRDACNDGGEGLNDIVVRFDGVVIDGSVDVTSIHENDKSTWKWFYSPDTRATHANLGTVAHPYAVGHRINHANLSGDVNVIQLAFDYPIEEFPEYLRPYVPNRLFKTGWLSAGFTGWLVRNGKKASLAHTLVYVATRDIEDEEIFVDYRLNPELGYPEWYTPLDEDEAARRWS